MESIKILEENDKYYIGEVEGNPIKLFKIDMKELELKHTDDLFNASSVISPFNFNEAIKVTRDILKNIPTVDEYEELAKYVVTLMNCIYSELKPYNLSHLMHHMIKNTDPSIYGKAQTFMNQIKRFNKDMEIIK